jgi:hypothetical protein
VRVIVDRCIDPCTLETIVLLDNSLVVLNAHCSPKLDPLDVAAEIGRRKLSNMSLFHQNHEQPWVDLSEKPSDWRNGYHGGFRGLAEAYHKWNIVLRQHHYDPLASLLAQHEGYRYVPLGPAYQTLNGNFNQLEQASGTRLLASQRKHLCFFAGAAEQFGGTADRALMLHVATFKLSPKSTCELHVAPKPLQQETPAKQMLSRDVYNGFLLQSKFALCPGGNSYETFRHWEAMGSGAIPISSLSHHNHSMANLWCSNSQLVSALYVIRKQKEQQIVISGEDRNGTNQEVDSIFTYDKVRDAAFWLRYVEALDCPLVLLSSWEDLPAFLNAFASSSSSSSSSSSTATTSNSNNVEGSSKERGEGSVQKILDAIQHITLSRADVIKETVSRDIGSLFT